MRSCGDDLLIGPDRDGRNQRAVSCIALNDRTTVNGVDRYAAPRIADGQQILVAQEGDRRRRKFC